MSSPLEQATATPNTAVSEIPTMTDVDLEKGNANKVATVGDQGWITDPLVGLTTEQVTESRNNFGPNEIPTPSTPLYVLFLRQFVGFMPLLIEIAALASLGVGDYIDFSIVVGMLLINGLLGFREEYHAKKSLDELANAVESEITVLRDGGQAEVVPTTELVPGDIVFLVGGSVVPADIRWLRGDTVSMDTAALTGEPVPRKYPSDEYGTLMLSGCTVRSGECYGQVMKTGTNTEIGQAQADVMKDKSVRIVSVFQRKIMAVVQTVIALSLAVVLAVLLVEGTVYGGFDSSSEIRATILDALGILIAAIPVALPLVLQVNMALGAAKMAKVYNAIVTSIPALQDIASMSILCSDKTGTLTTAKMSILNEKIYAADGFTPEDVLLYAYLCSNVDKKDDPIDRAVVTAFESSPGAKQKYESGDFTRETLIGFSPEVKRTVAFVSSSGSIITVAKGLPAKIMNTEFGGVDSHAVQWKIQNVSDKAFVDGVSEVDHAMSKAGYKTVGVGYCATDARSGGGVWHFVGLLPMLDPPREDTADTIHSLHHANISVKMITGDHVNVGRETAHLIGLGTDIQPGEAIRTASNEQSKKEMIWEADGFAAVLPSDKREVVLTLRNDFGVVTGMTGDGVNDAPALSAAQVGIAVEGATDAAKNAADLILTQPGLSPIYGAVIESRRIFARVKSYVVYRIAASIALVTTLSTVIFVSGCAVDSLLVIILALLNDVSMIPVAYDTASATAKPQLPEARKLVVMSLYFGVMQAGLALMFFFSLDHAQELDEFNINGSCNAETRGFVWFHLVLATELMIFSARAPSFFFHSMPSPVLIVSVLLTCILGGLIAYFAVEVPAMNLLWIFLFNLGAFVVIDVGKVWVKAILDDSPGDIITTDKLLSATTTEEGSGEKSTMSEAKRLLQKKQRYRIHARSSLALADRQHAVEIVDQPRGLVGGLRAQFGQLRVLSTSDGIVRRSMRHNTERLARPMRD